MLGLTEQGECSRTRRLESQQGPSYNDAIINGPMALHGLVDVPMNSPKLSDTDLFNILANEEIQAALKGKSVDEVMPTTTIEGNVIEIGSKEDMANKFEALENIILETPPDFIIVSVFDFKCEMTCSHGILVLVMILIQKLILYSLVTCRGLSLILRRP